MQVHGSQASSKDDSLVNNEDPSTVPAQWP
jgi:hypothetical protein